MNLHHRDFGKVDVLLYELAVKMFFCLAIFCFCIILMLNFVV